MTVQYTGWGALLAVRAALKAGLVTTAGGLLETINAEIASAGGLQALTTPTVVLRSQLPQAPEATLPLVVVVSDLETGVGRAHTPSLQRGEDVLGIAVGVFEAGAAASNESLSLDAEEDLVLRLRLWNQAVTRCLRRQGDQGGVLGVNGIERVDRVTRNTLLYGLDGDRIVRAAEVMTFNLQIKTR